MTGRNVFSTVLNSTAYSGSMAAWSLPANGATTRWTPSPIARCSAFTVAPARPLYQIEKRPDDARKQGAYSVRAVDGRILRRGHDLQRVLSVWSRNACNWWATKNPRPAMTPGAFDLQCDADVLVTRAHQAQQHLEDRHERDVEVQRTEIGHDGPCACRWRCGSRSHAIGWFASRRAARTQPASSPA